MKAMGGAENVDQARDQSLGTGHVGAVGLGIVGTSVITIGVLCMPFLRSFTGAPYVASSNTARASVNRFLQTQAMNRHKIGRSAGRLVDLGSGSGEMVIDAAEMGYDATGVEMNVWLVAVSRMRAWRRGVHGAKFMWGDMWKVDVTDCDAIVLFGVPRIMRRVGEKLRNECREGCVVCSNTFDIPGWKKSGIEGGVRFYRIEDAMKQKS